MITAFHFPFLYTSSTVMTMEVEPEDQDRGSSPCT